MPSNPFLGDQPLDKLFGSGGVLAGGTNASNHIALLAFQLEWRDRSWATERGQPRAHWLVTAARRPRASGSGKRVALIHV